MECVLRIPVEKASGYSNGRDTIDRIESIVESGKWTDLNVVGIVARKRDT